MNKKNDTATIDTEIEKRLQYLAPFEDCDFIFSLATRAIKKEDGLEILKRLEKERGKGKK